MKYLLILVLLVGCSSSSEQPFPKTYHTHKVWENENYVWWQSDDGYGCGNIQRTGEGWVYDARVIDWSNVRPEPKASFNNFESAVKFVEQWCKP